VKIAIIGQGYVGLALAKAASNAGHKVVGFDTNLKVIEDIKSQISKGEFLDKTNYLPTSSEIEIKDQIDLLRMYQTLWICLKTF
jgi:UDP-N-acetyl-D-mannosaminuronate dehydrogenase